MNQDLQAMTAPELERLKQDIIDELARRVNASGLKPGDKVSHVDGTFKIGTVLEMAKSGKTVKVKYIYLGTWQSQEIRAYFALHKLRKVGEAKQP